MTSNDTAATAADESTMTPHIANLAAPAQGQPLPTAPPKDDAAAGTPTILDLGIAAPPLQDSGQQFAAAATTASGRSLGDLGAASSTWREQEAEQARKKEEARRKLEAALNQSDSYAQFVRCFPTWRTVLRWVHSGAQRRMAAGEPVDPNDPSTWLGLEAHAQAVLRRHGLSKIEPHHLTWDACKALATRQKEIDYEVGLDWKVVTSPATKLDSLLAAAHRDLPIDLGDPMVWENRKKQRAVLCERLGLEEHVADDLSRYVLAHPDEFDPAELRCWRIGSSTWETVAVERFGPVTKVDRPVGAFLQPSANGRGWILTPVLSLDCIRLVLQLGGTLDRGLRNFTLPAESRKAFAAAVNHNSLMADQCAHGVGEKSTEISRKLSDDFGVVIRVAGEISRVEKWGRLDIKRWADQAVHASVFTTRVKSVSVKRLGSAKRGNAAMGLTHSAVMDLGEAVNVAVDADIPLLLSTEAAGHLAGTVRVGRMRGKPGMVTITTSDGVAATTRKHVVTQAVSELRKLKQDNAAAVLDAGARQVLRMELAKPLADDPVLKEPQQSATAKMVVGSGCNFSETATGKTVQTGRSIYHRAQATPSFRGMVVADARLLPQWHKGLVVGQASSGMPALAPNITTQRLDETQSITAQIRAWHRNLGASGGIMLVSGGELERHASELKTINWHVQYVDEAHRYRNPATVGHRALLDLRLAAVADCWLLTATPQGKKAEDLDILVGIAVGDPDMVRDRLNTREAGDLMDEVNAHRVRVAYGPHVVRVTKKSMAAWMPKVLPAKEVAIPADPALTDLLEAIRTGGQDAYRSLLTALAKVKKMDPENPAYKEALAEVSRWQGYVLGNVGVFLDASIDPETLKHSQAALAQAVVVDGLVDRAMRGGGDGLPTLRGIVAQSLSGLDRDVQSLVFCERKRPLHQLAAALNDRYNVPAVVLDGSVDPETFEKVKADFWEGQYKVLLLSNVGREGHDLQCASHMVHLDLGWLPDGIDQRAGRSARLGNPKGAISTNIPYIEGGGVEHQTKVLSTRAAENYQMLDSYEGIAADESTLALQLGGITARVAASKEEAGYEFTAAKLKVAAAVFGA